MPMNRIDIAIIGSGPCALALISRLAAPSDAIDTSADFLWGFDSETESLQSTIRRLSALKSTKHDKSLNNESHLHGRVKVFEKTGAWMGSWDGLFEALNIQHLRSPHVVHPSPTHTHALLAHSKSMKGDVRGKAEQEHFADFQQLRYRGCHRAPSVKLFRSLCEHLRQVMELDSLLEQATVVAIEPVYEHRQTGKVVTYFRLTLRRGGTYTQMLETVEAKSVVVATGATSCPRLPEWWSSCLASHVCLQNFPPYALRHAWDLPQDLCASSPCFSPLRAKERVLIVGGGLTAAQLAVLIADQGHTHACLVSRRSLEVKQFDFSDAWMDRKQRPGLLRAFLHAKSHEERLALIQAARGLSSIPPEAIEMLQARRDRIDARECTEVASFPPPRWDTRVKMWRVILECHEPARKKTPGKGTIREEHFFDRIWCATGSDARLDQHTLLGGMQDHRPIQTCDGFPCLTPYLAWDPDCDLYVLGAPAALVLGPDAFNLMGARTGAARVAHVLSEILNEKRDEDSSEGLLQAKQNVEDLQFNYDRKREGVRGVGLGAHDTNKNEKNKGKGICPLRGKPRRSCC